MKNIPIILILVLLFFSSCSQTNNIDVVDFESCIKAGNAIMESYPRQCRHTTGELFIEELEDEPRICTQEYAPVCAQVQVQCIRAPCPPLNQTFSNACEAGDNEILYEGECIQN